MYVLTTLSCRLPAVFLSGDVMILPAPLVARVCGDVEHGRREDLPRTCVMVGLRPDDLEQETVVHSQLLSETHSACRLVWS